MFSQIDPPYSGTEPSPLLRTRWTFRPPFLISSMARACFMPLVLSPLISRISSPTQSDTEQERGCRENKNKARYLYLAVTSSKHSHAQRNLKMKVEFPLFYFPSLPLVICQRIPSGEYHFHINGSSADNSLRFTESLCVAILSSKLQSLVQRRLALTLMGS